MGNSLQVFNSEDFGNIRALTIDNEPWFVAKDVCDALGIDTNHVREALDEDEVNTLRITEGKGNPNKTIITEAARQLSQYDKTINRKRLFALLRADGLICKQDNAPTKKAIQRGYMVQMMTTRADGKANDPYARMTRRGIDYCLRNYCTAHIV